MSENSKINVLKFSTEQNSEKEDFTGYNYI